MPSLHLFLSLSAVHGFASASYNVIEDTNLATTFSLNVKGRTTLVGAVAGVVTSQAGGTSRKLLLHDPDINYWEYGMFLRTSEALYLLQ